MATLEHLDALQQTHTGNEKRLADNTPLRLLHRHALPHDPDLLVHQIQAVAADYFLAALQQRGLHTIVLKDFDQGVPQALDFDAVGHPIDQLHWIDVSSDVVQ